MHSSNTASLISSKLFDVEGWKVIVTGGGSGIGLMAAQAFAANGAKVYIIGRRIDALEQAAKVHSPKEGPGEIIPLQGDVTSKSSITALVKEISSKEPYINCLFNNAGVSGPKSSYEVGDESPEKLSEEMWKEEFDDWNSVWSTNVSSIYFLSSAFLPLLSKATDAEKGHSGSIINTSSISGIHKDSQNHILYNVSKAGTVRLTELLANEFSREPIKVRVNSVAPGFFPSEMTDGESDENQKSYLPAGSEFKESKDVPAGRPGNDRDMAQTILFFATNTYVNGQTVIVDGGRTLKRA